MIQEKDFTSEGIELSGGMTKRQILNIDLKEVKCGKDPLTEKFYLRVYWKQDEKLEQDYGPKVPSPSIPYIGVPPTLPHPA